MSFSSVRELLNSLNVTELKEALSVIDPAASSSGRKEDTIDKLLEAGSVQKVEQVAARAECLAPFKHSWLFRLEDQVRQKTTVEQWSRMLWHEHFVSTSELDRESNDLQPTLQMVDNYSGRLYIKFTHWIPSSRYEQISPTTRELQRDNIQHTVVAVLRTDLNTLEVRFNGFKQGRATRTEDKISYVYIAQVCRDKIAQRLNQRIENVALDRAALHLTQAKPDEVLEVGRVIVTAEGRLSLRNSESDEGGDVVSLLFNSLRNVIAKADLRKALMDAPAESLWLWWTKHEIATRITQEYGAYEILFIWKGNKASGVVDNVVRELMEAFLLSSTIGTRAQIQQYIEGLASERVFLLSEVSHRFNTSYQQVLSILETARKAGLVERRYRIKSASQIQDFRNIWQTSLSGLSDTVSDENGIEINLRDPGSIEVGYCRI